MKKTTTVADFTSTTTDLSIPDNEYSREVKTTHVDSLDRRVADLEERLDFTERLLAQRNQQVPGSV